jgi:hypothetical protein
MIASYLTVFRCVRETKGVVLEDMPDAPPADIVSQLPRP